MKVNYIRHSGFLLEWDNCYWLFDYYRDRIPELDPKKSLFVFVSHDHEDHFNEEIFNMFGGRDKTLFLLSEDCDLWGLEPDVDIVTLKPNEHYVYNDFFGKDIDVTTLESTDQGVAFLIKYMGRTVYFSGDLHWWDWPGEMSPGEREDMKRRYFREVEKLRGVKIDLAFAVLDPRQHEIAWQGMDKLMRTADVDLVIPIHMWRRFKLIERFKELDTSADYRDKVLYYDEEKPTITLWQA